jgi:hypothetical protein
MENESPRYAGEANLMNGGGQEGAMQRVNADDGRFSG